MSTQPQPLLRKPNQPAVSHAAFDELLTTDEVAELLKMSARYIRDHRKESGFIRMGGNKRAGRLRFRRASVENYLRRLRVA